MVGLIIGAMALSMYNASIADDRANAIKEIDLANAAATRTLEREIALIEETERKAADTMVRKLAAGSSIDLGEIFVQAPDGAMRTPDELWDGREFSGGISVEGIGGFLAPPRPQGERRATILSAFQTLKQMANGLPSRIESLYFFSPANDLLIYAPRRPDQLSFYRNAPADFEFQESEFSRITSPSENPAGDLRCTSLQRPAYDESGDSWTTGCMLPVRVDGRHLGAWGVSIPLEDLTQKLGPPPAGAHTIIVSGDGKLIHHSGATDNGSRILTANLDLAASPDAMLRAVWRHLQGGSAERTEFAPGPDAYLAVRRLDAPDWYVLTLLPEAALSERAWAVAQRVIIVATTGALVLGLLLAAIFHRAIALRIARLGTRIDRVAATEGMELDAGTSDEITQLENAFDQMERRLALARSRERRSFDVLVDAAERYAMILFDEHGALLRASKGAHDLFGEDEIARLAVRWGLVPDDNPSTDLADRPGPEPTVVERELPQGRKVWLEEALVALEDEAGAPFGTAYIGHDITELRAAQRAIEENLLYLELAQASAQVGHFALDPQTLEVSLSEWLRERLGVATPAIPLSRVAEFIDTSQREATMEAISQAIASRSEFSFETVAIGADGAPFPVIVRGAAVFQDATDPIDLIGYYGIVQDITEQKQAAEELLRARDAARAEARAKTDILAVISHEIRTPISGILGLIDQIRRERSESERSRALTLIEDSSEALLKTLDATLQRTRSEREEVVSLVEEFQPAELLKRVAELFRPLARRKGIALDIEVGSDARVIGEPSRIQQVLANFLSNAIKFTPMGKVTLSVAPSGTDTGMWSFSVEDTGSGIDPERLKTIFEPFSGSAPDTLGRFTGSGLGLSITRDLAQQMGGSVTAESVHGGGTRMVLKLPLETVTRGEDVEPERGTIAVRLAKASLALRVEVIAHNKGFSLVEPSGEGNEIDVLVTDDPEAELRGSFKRIVALVEGDDNAKGSKTTYATEAELLEALPDLLEEVADG